MKFAITATETSLHADVKARLCRAPYHIIVETDSLTFQAIENPYGATGGSAGIQSAQTMSERNVAFVLTCGCSPNALQVFNAAGVQIIVGVNGSVRQVIEQFKAGAFSPTTQPSVESHFSMETEDVAWEAVKEERKE